MQLFYNHPKSDDFHITFASYFFKVILTLVTPVVRTNFLTCFVTVNTKARITFFSNTFVAHFKPKSLLFVLTPTKASEI